MNENIASVILDNIPGFVQEDYPVFTKFIEAYFNWLETDSNFVRALLNHPTNNDIFESDEYIAQKISGLGFPGTTGLKIPAAHFANMLRDFYITRGSAESFRFLFRAFYGEEIEVGYPREYLASTSQIRWGNANIIYVTSTQGYSQAYRTILYPDNQASVELEGMVSGMKIQCEKIIPLENNGQQYLKVYVSNAFGQFANREPIRFTYEDYHFTESLLYSNLLKIADGGRYYKIGDTFEAKSDKGLFSGTFSVSKIFSGAVDTLEIVAGGNGYKAGDILIAARTKEGAGFAGEVSAVNGSGSITQVRVVNGGWNFISPPEIVIKSINGMGGIILAHSSSIGRIKDVAVTRPLLSSELVETDYTIETKTSTGIGAVFELDPQPIFKEPSYNQTGSNGVLGGKIVLTDSNYFQRFSYELTTTVAKDEHSRLTEMCHPAGTVQYNKMLVESKLNIGVPQVRMEIDQINI